MKILIVILLIGFCGVNSYQSKGRKLRILDEENIMQYLKKGGFRNDIAEFFTNSFDLTAQLNYTNWEHVLRDYEYFESHRFRAKYHRTDFLGIEGGFIFRADIATGWELAKVKKYDYDIEKNDGRTSFVYSEGPLDVQIHNYSPGSLKKDIWDPTSRIIFYEILWYGLSRHDSSIRCVLQQYMKNGHLMLRTVYLVKLESSGSLAGSFIEIITGDYALLYK